MIISEKKREIKKNQCVRFAAFTASLALCHLSDVSADAGYVSPTAAFLSVETCTFPVDCEVNKALAGPGGNGRNGSSV